MRPRSAHARRTRSPLSARGSACRRTSTPVAAGRLSGRLSRSRRRSGLGRGSRHQRSGTCSGRLGLLCVCSCRRLKGTEYKGSTESRASSIRQRRLLVFCGADARNRTEDSIIASRPRPCLQCRPSLHTDPHSATISTVSHGHVGKIVGKGGGSAGRAVAPADRPQEPQGARRSARRAPLRLVRRWGAWRFIVKLKALRKAPVVVMPASKVPRRLRSCPGAYLCSRGKSLVCVPEDREDEAADVLVHRQIVVQSHGRCSAEGKSPPRPP